MTNIIFDLNQLSKAELIEYIETGEMPRVAREGKPGIAKVEEKSTTEDMMFSIDEVQELIERAAEEEKSTSSPRIGTVWERKIAPGNPESKTKISDVTKKDYKVSPDVVMELTDKVNILEKKVSEIVEEISTMKHGSSRKR